MARSDFFTPLDYVIFVAMLLCSAVIGIYYAFKGVHSSHEEFVLGGRRLHCFPVALSLTASFMSAVTVLGTPAEVYLFGMKFALFAFAYVVMVAITAHVFVPVYYRLRITSAYEYLELRYNKYLRMIGTVMFILQTVLYSGIVIYAPSLALNQVTGFQLWGAMIGTGIICTLYCTLGGLRAVVWTDVFQFLLMITAFILIIGRTVTITGGFGRILNDARQGERLAVWDFNPSPLQRHTFWTVVVGGSFTWLGVYAVNQSQVQRYLSCKTLSHAKLPSIADNWYSLSYLYLSAVGTITTFIVGTVVSIATGGLKQDTDPNLVFGKEDLLADYEYLKAKAAVIYETFHPAQQEVPEEQQ